MGDGPMSLEEKIERFCDAVESPPPPRVTKKVAWICYSGEDVEPDPMDNLEEERRSAIAVSKDIYCPEVCRRSLMRYVERIQKLVSTSAKPTDER